MKKNLTLVITGSRGLIHEPGKHVMFFKSMTRDFGTKHLFHGAAQGVDLEVAKICAGLGWHITPVPVTDEEWRTHGKAAGFHRNLAMLQDAIQHAEANDNELKAISMWDGESPGTRNMMVHIAQHQVDCTDLGARLLGPDNDSQLAFDLDSA